MLCGRSARESGTRNQEPATGNQSRSNKFAHPIPGNQQPATSNQSRSDNATRGVACADPRRRDSPAQRRANHARRRRKGGCALAGINTRRHCAFRNVFSRGGRIGHGRGHFGFLWKLPQCLFRMHG
jgi:hypothetical protein